MLHYRAYLLDTRRRIAQPANDIEAATDDDAIKIAEKCLDDRDLALWQGPRLVITLKSKARPRNAKTGPAAH
jgi:hypothetical protein